MDLLAVFTLFLPLQLKHWFLIYVIEVGHSASRLTRVIWPFWLALYITAELLCSAVLLRWNDRCSWPLVAESFLMLIACLIERRSRMRSLFRVHVYVETMTTALYFLIAILPFCKDSIS